MKTIEFYYVRTQTRIFFVNAVSEERARKLVEEDYNLEPIESGNVLLLPNLCCDIENIFM